MDYKKLLIKYMAYVGHNEGIYYIDKNIPKAFTSEEVTTLYSLCDEADKLDLYPEEK